MGAIDVTDQVLERYAQVPRHELKRRVEEAPLDLHPEAAEMFVYMAEHAVHNINDGGDGTAYEDFTVPLTGLALTNCLVACQGSNVTPSYAKPKQSDPWVCAAFARQVLAELNREQEARLRHGLWRCWFDQQSDRSHQRITRRRRKSALTLLDRSAQLALLQRLLGRSLQDLSADELYHALAENQEMLVFLTRTDPDGWAKFEAAMDVSALELSALAGFLQFLKFAADTAGHSYWYEEPFLVTLWNIYTQAYPQYNSISSDSLLHAIRYFSMTPSEAASCLVYPPFYFLHGKLLRNPCFLGASNFLTGLLTIAIRKNEEAWSRTLGSTLARAADTLSEFLPRTPRLKVAVRRSFPGGDVDLAIYDVQTRELLVCEVKTVYDKHRTDSLMNRFEDAKVNVQKAVSQLRTTATMITEGKLTLQQLFGNADPIPIRVHMALLTWLDPIDLTMGTSEEDILSLNFATFLWLVHASAGDVQALVTAIRELRNLWTVALTRPLDLGQSELNADLEVQTGLLDARSDLAQLPLSPLCLRILDSVGTVDELPDDIKDQEWISYLEDSRQALSEGPLLGSRIP